VHFKKLEKSKRHMIEEVKRRIARVSSHPGMISATIEGGRLMLSGPVLRSELLAILSAISDVVPVDRIDSQLVMLEPKISNAFRPADRMGYMEPFFPSSLSPSMRTALGGGSLLAVGWGLRRGGMGGYAVALAGMGGLIRAVTNIETSQLIGAFIRPVVRLKRSIGIPVPIDEVYAWWRRFENFPKFMSFVSEVQMTMDGLLHWTITGPGGILLQWKTSLDLRANESLEWKSVPGSIIMSEGWVRMSQISHESTLLEVELCYAPPAGALGYNVARALGFNPRSRIDGDLQIMKELVVSDHLKKFRRVV
jgi:uncharacterized membrane protein